MNQKATSRPYRARSAVLKAPLGALTVLVILSLAGCGGSGGGTGGTTNTDPYSGKSYSGTGFQVTSNTGTVAVQIQNDTLSGSLTLKANTGRAPKTPTAPQPGTYSFSGAFTGTSTSFTANFSSLSGSTISGQLPALPATTGGSFSLSLNGTTYGPFTFSNQTTSTLFSVKVVGLRAAGGDTLGEDMNNSGEIVGAASDSSGVSHAFSWTATGGLVDRGLFGGIGADAEGVDDSGNIAGEYEVTGSPYGNFFYNSAPVNPAGGFNVMQIVGMTSTGQVVLNGFSLQNSIEEQAGADVYAGGKFTNIGDGPGADVVQMSKSGGVVYGQQASATSQHATVFWQWNGTSTASSNWNTFFFPSNNLVLSPWANCGAHGEALGTLTNGDAGYISASGVTTDLGQKGTLMDLNANGQGVGNFTDAKGNPHGFFWTKAMGFQDLDTMISATGVSILSAKRINANGQILCQTSSPSVQTDTATGVAALLTPS